MKMNIAIEILWIIIAFFIGALLEVLLPEKYRMKFQLRKKMISKWIKNPTYRIGISSRMDFKQSMDLQNTTTRLRQIFANKSPTTRGNEIHFTNSQYRYDAYMKIQPAYHQNEDILEVFSLNITSDSQTRYRNIITQIIDLIDSLDETERELIRNLDLFPAGRTLYVEIEYLEEFSEILENLSAQQIEGSLKEADTRFVYYGNRLTIEDSLNSTSIEWFKNVIAYVG
ncbi:MAG: hypothetical protein JSV88_04525 [Candidatus Aminicenantes bacterium]|nr:MAG: hypothetical protein JSV88_04525 [Candidatus Aminicenantes bacterium]